jgi:hypothetical protein
MAPNILLHTPSNIIRICLQVYFTVLFLLISVLGNSCCVLYARLQLARRGNIPVVKLTGWLDWAQAVLFNFHFRTNALGFVGVIMIFSSLLSKASNLAVAGLVNNVTIVTRCHFNTSGDYLILAPEYYGQNFGSPDVDGSFYNLVTQAQINSVRHGGVDAIYKKVNTDVSFRADPSDVYANWRCNELQDQSIAPIYDAYRNDSEIWSDLGERNLLFTSGQNAGVACWRNPNGTIDGRTNQLTIITANNTQDTNGTFSIRASFDTTQSYTDPKVMRSFECNLEPQNTSWMLTHINIASTLGPESSWCNLLRGDMYEGYNISKTFITTPEAKLQSYLHAMIMSTNPLVGQDSHTSNDTQGCVDTRTIIPLPITVLIVVAALCFVSAVCTWFVLWVMVHLQPGAQILSVGDDGIPVGLLGWMNFAVRNSSGAGRSNDQMNGAKRKDLCSWYVELVPVGGKSELRLRRV